MQKSSSSNRKKRYVCYTHKTIRRKVNRPARTRRHYPRRDVTATVANTLAFLLMVHRVLRRVAKTLMQIAAFLRW